MNQADYATFEQLKARVGELSTAHQAQAEQLRELFDRVVTLEEKANGKDVHGELMGAAPDHTAERAERDRAFKRPR